ncbi:MAG: hypothetical protein N2Z74_01595, partial [Syntrophales bacterium]|nr:hypothetical protein [Syntrophales bacterium]
GFLFIPIKDIYTFEMGPSNQRTFMVNGVRVDGAIALEEGFHPYHIIYEGRDGPYGLPFMVRPQHGEAYIPPDGHLATTVSPEHLRLVMATYGRGEVGRNDLAIVRENLVANGDFEESQGKDPRVWRMECWQAPGTLCRYGTLDGEAVTGRRFGYIVQEGPADCRWVQDVLLKPRTRYRLSGWIKVKDVPQEGPGAYLQVEGTHLKTSAVKGTTGWRFVEATIQTGGKPILGKVLCRLGDYGAPTQGTVMFDRIVLQEGN